MLQTVRSAVIFVLNLELRLSVSLLLSVMVPTDEVKLEDKCCFSSVKIIRQAASLYHTAQGMFARD